MIPSDLLLMAYRSGIFPMSEGRDDEEIFWVEPRERAIIPLDGFRCSKSLRKIVRQDHFRVTCNQAFERIIEACAAPRGDEDGSWISNRIEASYLALHHAGHAHSIEVWRTPEMGGDMGGDLVGGLYGVSFDQVFCGESMFSRADNASKVALAWLVAILRQSGAKLLDCQFMTDHLATMGAIALPQERYLDLLENARARADMSVPDAYAALLTAASSGAGAGSAGTAADGLAASLSSASAGSAPEVSPGKFIAQSLTQTS
ncbi:leucyl/phenylalanyl-tRNA--protein transferase [Altererythrobacter confluentis]|uniref:Leucyl/phenylalanyl-tRNA--protein transferase n=1 Tax=Allopontixanthobacter confluentis TaxID=1849021 RepID=A0A6L7GDG8_9SPHN|nr:leucyl/phenylalanyl-tRNA--protein transferase [Allopontixanthobacter confluentis]